MTPEKQWWMEAVKSLIEFCHENGDVNMDVDQIKMHLEKLFAESQRLERERIVKVLEGMKQKLEFGTIMPGLKSEVFIATESFNMGIHNAIKAIKQPTK